MTQFLVHVPVGLLWVKDIEYGIVCYVLKHLLLEIVYTGCAVAVRFV